MRPEVILLDCGGTLTWPPFDRLTNILRELKGTQVPLEVQLRAFHRGSHALEAYLKERHELPTADVLELGVWIFNAGLSGEDEAYKGLWDIGCARAMVERGERLGNWDYTFPHVKSCLEKLKRAGYRLAVVSNADGHVEEMLTRLGYAPYFEAIIDSEVVGVAKPDPRIFYLALERIGLAEYVKVAKAAADGHSVRPPVLHIGDSHRNDYVGARTAGLHAWLLDPLGLYSSWAEQRCAEIRAAADKLA